MRMIVLTVVSSSVTGFAFLALEGLVAFASSSASDSSGLSSGSSGNLTFLLSPLAAFRILDFVET